MTETQDYRLHALITGMVQGVGFRFFVLRSAEELGLAGWVRNRWDGTVEMVAEGSQPSLEKLLRFLQRGPYPGTTSQVQYDWLPASGEFSTFHIKMTV